MREITRLRIFHKHGKKCFDCGKTDCKFEMHHVIPLCAGGRDDEDNIVPLCHDCHKRKPRSANYSRYFKIGENKDYIFINTDIIKLHLNSELFVKIIDHYIEENNRLFGDN
jgi:hypothetical protein